LLLDRARGWGSYAGRAARWCAVTSSCERIEASSGEKVMSLVRSVVAVALVVFASGCASASAGSSSFSSATVDHTRNTAVGLGAYADTLAPHAPEQERDLNPAGPSTARPATLEAPPRQRTIAFSRFESVVRRTDCSMCRGGFGQTAK
jgi:hypothetical protein